MALAKGINRVSHRLMQGFPDDGLAAVCNHDILACMISLQGLAVLFNWLRVLDTAERSQVDQHIR
jgi:hypothetical protein